MWLSSSVVNVPVLPAGVARRARVKAPFVTGVTRVGEGGTWAVPSFRRQRSLRRRVIHVARRTPEKGRELRAAASQLDIPWARTWFAGVAREAFMRFVLGPTMDFYTARRATGREKLAGLRGPLILVANHSSHMDTPVILSALPRRLRKRTAVAAAADYFYRNRVVASLVSFMFNTVPIERRGGGLGKRDGTHLDQLLDQGWNLLLYPEGTRTRSGGPGRVRRGAAVLAAAHNLSIVPIRVTGTREAMPPGRFWPRRRHGKVLSHRHNIEISFGEPIKPNGGDATALIERVQRFFEDTENGQSANPYRRLSTRAGSR
jgi:1-acyl-sn-glycerol-3-phosphate acyltransferase